MYTCVMYTAQPLHPTLQQPSPMKVQGATVVTNGGELKVAVLNTLGKSTLDSNHYNETVLLLKVTVHCLLINYS